MLFSCLFQQPATDDSDEEEEEEEEKRGGRKKKEEEPFNDLKMMKYDEYESESEDEKYAVKVRFQSNMELRSWARKLDNRRRGGPAAPAPIERFETDESGS